MEADHIGEHCSKQLCGQRDFLPFLCRGCSRYYCLAHRMYGAHECKDFSTRQVEAVDCPVCQQRIMVSASAEEGALEMRQHLASGCSQRTAERSCCSLSSCSVVSDWSVVCTLCSLSFCLKHRHPTDHACAVYAQQLQADKERGAEKDAMRERASKVKETAAVKARNSQMGQKLERMKTKMAATGEKGIPADQRFSVKVVFDSSVCPGPTPSPVCVYFRKDTPFGRVLDTVTSMARIENRNNTADAQKLVFTVERTTMAVPLSQSLHSFGDDLLDGETLVLSRV
eukprot:GILK01004996.1.p1 GENE.GILK01004996.1~~GILK01004996.1.p1  ORF type:complete len:284 (-),score=34.73 GILK01004996.1:391-1242(-)